MIEQIAIFGDTSQSLALATVETASPSQSCCRHLSGDLNNCSVSSVQERLSVHPISGSGANI
jgi:hypothetical protein